MTQFSTTLATLFVLVLSTPTWAINKCIGADGKTVFQDAACADKGEVIVVKPASGTGSTSGVASGASEADRINAQTDKSQKERRIRELQTLWIPQAQSSLATHKRTCDQQQRDLSSDQYRYKQNLYGKTHAAQRASEMAAVAATCDTKDRELTGNLERLKSELTELKK